MSHLSLETIARLVDDAPGPEEAAHLESCAACRSELEAMTEDVHSLALLPDMAQAPDDWPALERRLVEEGLIRAPTPILARTPRLLQLAAALLLFIGGSVAGRMTADPATTTLAQAQPEPGASSQSPAPPAVAVQSEPAAPAPVSDPEQPEPAPRARSTGGATLVANGGFGSTRPGTLEEAVQLLRQTEELYLSALTRYAELASQAETGDPVARLAALQSIILTTQAALNQTPTDPIINGYHLTALAQRDATLRQVAAASSERWY